METQARAARVPEAGNTAERHTQLIRVKAGPRVTHLQPESEKLECLFSSTKCQEDAFLNCYI